MAKRNTTGMPKKERDTERGYRSRAEKERYYQRIAFVVAAVMAAVVGVILIGALVNDYFLVPQQAISTVNGTEIETDDFRERVRAEKWFLANEIRQAIVLSRGNQQLQQALLSQLPPIPAPYTNDPIAYLQDDRAVARNVLQNMELQAVLEQKADDLGVDVDEGKVQAQVDEYFARYTNANLTPTPVPSETPLVTTTPTPLITATPSSTPTETPVPSVTPLPTTAGCAEGEDCPTVTPLPSSTPTEAPTATPENSPTPMPTSTPISRDEVKATLDTFSDDFYGDANEVADVDRSAVRDIFYLRALRAALRDKVTEDIANEEVWANTRHILFQATENQNAGQTAFSEAVCETDAWQTTKAEADAVYAALQDGEPFATLAQAVSDDPSGADGGNLGWSSTTGYVGPFQEAVNTADIGAYLEPVCTQFGWHIIQVLDREVREIPEFQLRQQRQQEYSSWEQEQLLNADIERREDWPDRIPEEPTYDELLGDIAPASSNRPQQ